MAKRSISVYVRPKQNPKKKKAKKSTKKTAKKTAKRKTTAPRKATGAQNTFIITNPKKKKNPPPAYSRGAGGESLRDFTQVLKPGLAAFFGYCVPGLIWKVIGAGARQSMMGWFKDRPESGARSVLSLFSLVGLWWLTNSFSLLHSYQKSTMLGATIRTALETGNWMLGDTPGSGSETFRMILGLPTASTVGQSLAGRPWNQGTMGPPPTGTRIDPQTGRLVPISDEEEDFPSFENVPYYGQQQPYYGQQQPYYGQQQPQNPALPPMNPAVPQPPQQGMPGIGAPQQVPPMIGAPQQFALMPMQQFSQSHSSLGGYAVRNQALGGYEVRALNPGQLAGYAVRSEAQRVPSMVHSYPRGR